jgi:hypothetical protein
LKFQTNDNQNNVIKKAIVLVAYYDTFKDVLPSDYSKASFQDLEKENLYHLKEFFGQ